MPELMYDSECRVVNIKQEDRTKDESSIGENVKVMSIMQTREDKIRKQCIKGSIE